MQHGRVTASGVPVVDECGTCRKALPAGCNTEFQGEQSCALTHGVQDRFGDADLAPGKHGGTVALMPSGVAPCGGCHKPPELTCAHFKAASGVALPAATVSIDVLRQHWLTAMECDPVLERNKPHCFCSLVDLGWHPSVGAAFEAWLTHVLGVALPLNDQPKGGA